MAFQLSLINSQDEDQTHFGKALVREFSQAKTKVGRDSDSDFQVDEEDFPQSAFQITVGRKQRLLWEQGDGICLVNGEPAETGGELLSGDVIRVGKWQFTLNKIYPEFDRSRRRNGLVLLAKTLLAVVVLSQFLLAICLPQMALRGGNWSGELPRMRTLRLYDRLHDRVADLKTETEVQHAIHDALSRNLIRQARYIRHARDNITPEQYRAIYQDLLESEKILALIESGKVLQDIQDIDIDTAVKSTIQQARQSNIEKK